MTDFKDVKELNKWKEAKSSIVNTLVRHVGYEAYRNLYANDFEVLQELEEENELLKRENKALADDNEMKCELNEKLSKALDRACECLESISNTINKQENIVVKIETKEEWKEYLLDENNG